MTGAIRVGFHIVDVFTGGPFAGNQLCVVPDAGGLSSDTMQRLAAEIGFSETAFVTEATLTDYTMRIFTPTVELPFAGHPSVGSGFVLSAEGFIGTEATQHVAAGDFPVSIDLARAFAEVQQLSPTFGDPIAERSDLSRAIGLSTRDLHPEHKPRVVSTGIPFLIVPLASDSAVAHAAREPGVLARLLHVLDVFGVYLFAETGDVAGTRTAHARMFDADLGIGEDPATGSAVGCLAAYLARFAGPLEKLEVRQGEEIGRPSVLHVRVVPTEGTWTVHVGGGVYRAGEGTFFVPQ